MQTRLEPEIRGNVREDFSNMVGNGKERRKFYVKGREGEREGKGDGTYHHTRLQLQHSLRSLFFGYY